MDSKINNFDQGEIMCTRDVLVGKLQGVVHIGYSCAEGYNPKSLMKSIVHFYEFKLQEDDSSDSWDTITSVLVGMWS